MEKLKIWMVTLMYLMKLALPDQGELKSNSVSTTIPRLFFFLRQNQKKILLASSSFTKALRSIKI